MMNKSLPEIDIIEGINGRFWDITKPLLQICKLVYPEGFEELINALLDISQQRASDKKESIEGVIIETLLELSPKNVPEWKIKTADVLTELNKNRPDNKKMSSLSLGRKLKAMGIHTRRIHGISEIVINTPDFNILLTQFGFENVSVDVRKKMLPNATKATCLTELRDSTGSIKVGFGENATKMLPAESLENKGQVGEVALGSISGRVGKETSESDFTYLTPEEMLEVG